MLANVIETTDRNTLLSIFCKSQTLPKTRKIAKLEKDGYIVSVPTVGVDVYEMEL